MMKKFTFVTVLIVLFILTTKLALAASATLNVTPAKGSFGNLFDIAVNIDSGGEAFNAAKASVTLSPNLAIQNLVLGDCNFSFTKLPSISELSFEGVILGKSLKKCTLYTVTLAPIEKGSGTINITNASVLRYGDAANILSTTQNGSYELIDAVKVASASAFLQSQENLFSLNLSVFTDKNQPLKSTMVTLTPVGSNNIKSTITNESGLAQFSNLESGIYTAKVEKYSPDNILNISGNNKYIALGIKVNSPQNNLIGGLQKNLNILLIIIVFVLIAVILWLKVSTKRKRN